MTVHEIVGRNEKQMVKVLHHGHEAVLDVLEPLLGRVEPYLRPMTQLPYVDRLPTPRETVEQTFGFVDDLLKEEHEFFLRVVGLLPDHKRTPPVEKETTTRKVA